MKRIAKLAAGLLCLAFSCAAGQACQLSLLGAVMQQPLTYNPFDAGASPAAISFTLKNTDSKPCDAAFAFFKPGVPQASGAGGSLIYQIQGSGGPLTQNAVSPPATLPGAASAAYITVGAKQTYTAKAALIVSEGQVVPPGTYSDTLYLGIYQSAGGGQYTKAQIPVAPFGAVIGVNSQMTVAIAGGGPEDHAELRRLRPGRHALRAIAGLRQSRLPPYREFRQCRRDETGRYASARRGYLAGALHHRNQ